MPSAPSVTTSWPPSKGPRFISKELIGHGALGSVYRAEDQADGKSVALRALPPEAVAKNGALPALVADLKAAAPLSHPNLVRVLGIVDISGQKCVLTEFVRGQSVTAALQAGQRLSVPDAHGLGRLLTQTLAFVHSKGLVHGSVQPSNVMTASGALKLADLGLGRLVHAGVPPTPYRAPEGRFDLAGDVYGLAAVLYHLLTGIAPRANVPGALPPLPSVLAPGVPAAFDRLLMGGLDPRPEARLPTVEQVLRELDAMVRIG